MATITSPGIGSGLDVNSIVSQLVAAERAPEDKRLSTAQSQAQVQISAIGSFTSALSNLQAAADALAPSALSTSTFGGYTATPSDSTLFTAGASNKAVPGTYNVEVVSLASASKITSQAFVGGSTSVVGNGDVTLTVAGKSFTVTLADPANTLADLRDKINAASDNSGVGAAIVTDSAGAHLLLTSKSTGTANAVSLSSSLITTSSVQTATDAVVKVDGFSVTSSSNQVSNVVDGITLNLAKAAPGTVAQLSVGLNQTAATSAVQAFVTAYNSALGTINQLSSYNAATKAAGPMLGDPIAQGAVQRLRNMLSTTVPGAGTYTSLAQIGITTNKDGTLVVDNSKLGTALSTDFSSVQKLFGGSNGNGVAAQVSSFTKTLTDISGPLQAEKDSANSQLKDVTKQQDALNRRITNFQARTMAQFTALDKLLSNLKSTSDYLTQQLANLPKIN